MRSQRRTHQRQRGYLRATPHALAPRAHNSAYMILTIIICLRWRAVSPRSPAGEQRQTVATIIVLTLAAAPELLPRPLTPRLLFGELGTRWRRDGTRRGVPLLELALLGYVTFDRPGCGGGEVPPGGGHFFRHGGSESWVVRGGDAEIQIQEL